MKDDNDVFADAPIISSYSTDDAIDDGVLVHFAPITPGKWCVTRGVYDAISKNARPDRTTEQALHNMMSDVLAFVKVNRNEVVKQAEEGLPLFCNDFAKWMEGNITGKKLWLGGNETGGFTVMFPEER